MTIAYVQKATLAHAVPALGGNTVTFSSPTTSGNLLAIVSALFVNLGGATSGPTVTDNGGNSFSAFFSDTTGDGTLRLDVFDAKSITGRTGDAVTVNYGYGDYVSIVALEYSGMNTAHPQDQSISAWGSSTSADPGAITTNAGNLLLGILATTAPSASASALTSRAALTSGSPNLYVGDVLSTGTAIDATWTLSPTAEWVVGSASFAAPGTGTGGGLGQSGIMLAHLRRPVLHPRGLWLPPRRGLFVPPIR